VEFALLEMLLFLCIESMEIHAELHVSEMTPPNRDHDPSSVVRVIAFGVDLLAI
jgi:hypothetical protein